MTEWPDGILSARYRFRHALYREVLYQEIPEARRARLHRRIGEHLRAAFGPEDASLAAVLAVHFEKGRDAESAARYRRMAGERALGRHAYHEAAEHLEKALEAFDQARSRPADGDPEDRGAMGARSLYGTGNGTGRDPWLLRPGGHEDQLREPGRSSSTSTIPRSSFRLFSTCGPAALAAADFAESTNLVTRMTELAAETENDELAIMYSSVKARTQFGLGDLAGCAEHLRRVLTPYDPLRLADMHGRYGRG